MRTQWFTQEIDASQVVGSVSTSVAVFAGDFNKGPVQDYIQIGTVQELIDYYGYPDNENYNDWYQAYNFLQYANTLLISRACNINGSVQKLDGTTITSVGVQTDANDDDAILVQDAIPASSEIGTAAVAGKQGNEIVVSVTNGTPFVVEQAVAASCKYGTAKTAGVEGNKLKVAVTQNADATTFDVTVSNDMTVYTKTQVTSTNDLEENDYIVWTPDVDLAVEEVQLENGKDAVTQETFNVTTQSGFDEELTQENIKSSQELQDNEYVIFNKEIALAVKDYTFAGGADPVYKNMFKVGLSNIANVQVNDTVQFQEEIEGAERYKIKAIDLETRVITLDRELPEEPDDQPQLNSDVFKVQVSFNGSCEASSINNTQETEVSVTETETVTIDVPNDVGDEYTQFDYNKQVLNDSDFEANFDSIAFSNPIQAKVKFIARNPGKWSDSLRICIARPESFEANDNSGNHVPHYAFEGLPVDDYFEYAPKGTQVGVLIYDEDEEEVLETYTVDFNPDAKDYNNKSTYIENVINQQSSYVFVKVNSANDNEIADYTLVYDALEGDYVGKTLRLMNSSDSPIQRDDLLDAYDLFANKEEIDIDIVIANELDNGESARSLVTTREDCVGFIGCRYEDVVAKKSAIATDNLVTWRKNIINYNSSFLVACGNYCYVYDRKAVA